MYDMQNSMETISKYNLYSMCTNYIKIWHSVLRKPRAFLTDSIPGLILQQFK